MSQNVFRGRVLALTPVGGYGGFNTSVHRVLALRQLGFEVDVIDSAVELSGFAKLDYRIRSFLFRKGWSIKLPDSNAGRILSRCEKGEYQILWLEKALMTPSSVLREIKRVSPRTKIIGFSPDDMNARHNQSVQFLDSLPYYDLFLTTKTYNVTELTKLGCNRVEFIPNGYDPVAFHPVEITEEDVGRLGGDIGFIGSYERERAESMDFLAQKGLKVRVWGDGWSRMKKHHRNLRIEYMPLYGEDFAKACSAFKINLAFLRKINRDLQTTRSVEIPACGGFMLAERTNEHLGLFEESLDAAYFESNDELYRKCCYYLRNENMRLQVASNGYARCIIGRYSNAGRLASFFGRHPELFQAAVVNEPNSQYNGSEYA